MTRIRVYLFTLRQCWLSIFKINIGDTVVWKGERYQVGNGVTRPTWDLYHDETNEHVRVHESEFRKERTLRNAIHDVRFTWNFYSGYWFQIWFRNPDQIRSY